LAVAVSFRVFVLVCLGGQFGVTVGLDPGVMNDGVVCLELVEDEWPVGVSVAVIELLLSDVAVVGRGGLTVVLVGVPVLPPVAALVVVDEPGPSEFFDTSAAKPGLLPCVKSWYQWPMLSWMPKDDVLLAGVTGGTVEKA
jgi:hypothetical protein